MKKDVSPPHIIRTISELHRLFALEKPDHPLVSVINFELLNYGHSDVWKHFANDFYCVTLKREIMQILNMDSEITTFQKG